MKPWHPSVFGDVQLVYALRALRRHDVECIDNGERYKLVRGDRWAFIDVEDGMVSGLSMEAACMAISLDTLDVYMDIVRQEEKAERTR